MKVQIIKDKDRLFSFFKTNLCLFSYHIGDLDDFYFKKCIFYGLIDELNNEIEEICLIYKGSSTPTVLALGLSNKLNNLLQLIESNLPKEFYCHYLQNSESFFLQNNVITELGLHYKMFLRNYIPKQKIKNDNIIQLNKTHLQIIEQFYKEAYPGTYFEPNMLATGYYFGLFSETNKLISITGIHTFSEKHKIAVLGNIATHPEYRGKGYSYILNDYLLTELRRKVDFVSLNVKADNSSAIKLYEKLGFKLCTEFKEAIIKRKN